MRVLRIAFIALLTICASSALAYNEFGPWYGQQFAKYYPVSVRIGDSASANARGLRLGLIGSAGSPPRTLRAVYLYASAVQAPGQWTCSVASGSSTLASGTMSVAAAGWSACLLSSPAVLAAPNFGRIDVWPVAGAEATFGGLQNIDQQPDVQLGPDAYGLGRIYATNASGLTDGGAPVGLPTVAPYVASMPSVVLEFSDRKDPFAPSNCPPDASYDVSGNPYVEMLTVDVDAGAEIDQQFAHAHAWPQPLALTSARFVIEDYDAGAIAYELRTDGGVVQAGSVTRAMVFGSPALAVSAPACFPIDVAPAMYELAIQPRDGNVRFLVLSAGANLGECDAPARATWGGSVSRSTLGPGTDLLWTSQTANAFRYRADRDQDGFGDRSDPGTLMCPGTYSDGGVNLVPDGTDCDDTNAQVRPDAGEFCNGRDDNCDDRIDGEDNELSLPECELQLGVCSGAYHSASSCVDGGFRPCDAREYGADYSPQEPAACDGLDNDCDGTVTEIEPCPRQLGPCAGSHRNVCQSPTECSDSEYGPWFEASEQSCDGIDNDCDGLIDGADPELTGPLCENQIGVCAGARHSAGLCSAAGWGTCGDADYGDSFESDETRCDGLDNDCDGVVDEGCSGGSSSPSRCELGSGAPIVALALLSLLRKRRVRVAAVSLFAFMSACSVSQGSGDGGVNGPRCVATTCEALGFACGSWDDGCGGTLSCGTCSGAGRCVDGQCACAPLSCGAVTCGSIDDGCGSSRFCGSCAPGSNCSASGTCTTAPLHCYQDPAGGEWCPTQLTAEPSRLYDITSLYTRQVVVGTDGGRWFADAPGWELIHPTNLANNQSFRSAAASSANDVFFATDRTIEHFDGGTWRLEWNDNQPGAPNLRAVGVNATGDAWAVGESATLLHRDSTGVWKPVYPKVSSPPLGHVDRVLVVADGGGWASSESGLVRLWNDGAELVQPFPSPAHYQLAGVTNEDVWAVSIPGWSTPPSTVLHWNGQSWQNEQSPCATVMSIWSAGPTDVWFGCVGGLAYRWNGAVYEQFDTASPNDPNASAMISGSGPNDVWMVRGQEVLHFRGGRWRYFSSSPAGFGWLGVPESGVVLGGGFSGLFALRQFWESSPLADRRDIRAVSFQTSTGSLLYGGTEGLLTAPSGSSVGSSSPIEVIAKSADESYWAMGEGGRAFVLVSGNWKPIPTGTTETLFAAWVADASHAWAAGADGTILRFADGGWQPSPSSTQSTLRGMWGNADEDVWAVGDRGTLLHWDGNHWSAIDAGTNASLMSISGSDAGFVAVGRFGTVVRSNDGGLTAFRLPFGQTIRRVRMVSPELGYAITEDGLVIRYEAP